LADIIFVHSESNFDFLRKKNRSCENKLMVLHNWIDLRPFISISSSIDYRKEYDLDDKLIILFAGVLGPSQGLDFLIKVAEALREEKSVCFLMVGDGMEKKHLIFEANKKGLTNIKFKGFVSKEEYPKLLNNIDVGLVCLSCRNTTPVVPGKILGYMAASKPVLAFLNKESDAHEIVRSANCGYSAYSDDLNMAIQACRKMIDNRVKLGELGKNGLKYVSQHFEREKGINMLVEKF
jgi:glycosyltransferase involved in cell wall biosynthesis